MYMNEHDCVQIKLFRKTGKRPDLACNHGLLTPAIEDGVEEIF